MSKPIHAPVESGGMASGPALPGLSLAPLLHQLRPQRPDALIALPMWQAIEIAGSRLPPTSEFGFECHLLTGGQRADLVTRASGAVTDRLPSLPATLHPIPRPGISGHRPLNCARAGALRALHRVSHSKPSGWNSTPRICKVAFRNRALPSFTSQQPRSARWMPRSQMRSNGPCRYWRGDLSMTGWLVQSQCASVP